MQTTNVIDAPSASPLSALITMFHEPSRAFAMLAQRRSAWLPLVLLMASTAGLAFWYYEAVDYAWLRDQMSAVIPDAEQREQAMKMMTKGVMQWTAVGSSLLMMPFVAALMGLYFMIVGKIRNSDFGFGKGFALSLWASVPVLLLFVLGAMQIALQPDGRLDYSQLNPVSLNQLLFHVEMGHPWATLLDSLSVISIWSIALTVIGYRVWARVSSATAAKVVLVPYVVIYGIWAVICMMSQAA